MGSIPCLVIPKTLKMVTLLGAQHYKASIGFSSPKNIASLTLHVWQKKVCHIKKQKTTKKKKINK